MNLLALFFGSTFIFSKGLRFDSEWKKQNPDKELIELTAFSKKWIAQTVHAWAVQNHVIFHKEKNRDEKMFISCRTFRHHDANFLVLVVWRYYFFGLIRIPTDKVLYIDLSLAKHQEENSDASTQYIMRIVHSINEIAALSSLENHITTFFNNGLCIPLQIQTQHISHA